MHVLVTCNNKEDPNRLGRVGGQGGCERRIEVFVKIQKKKIFLGGGGGGGGGGRRGRRVRVDVNEKLKFL